MCFSKMKLKFLVIFVVNELQMRTVDFTDVAGIMSTHIDMYFECFQVIESTIAELTERVVENNLSCFAELSLSQMPLNIVLII